MLKMLLKEEIGPILVIKIGNKRAVFFVIATILYKDILPRLLGIFLKIPNINVLHISCTS